MPTTSVPRRPADLIFGPGRRDAIKSATCINPPIGCGQPAVEFTDELSRREFNISGLCQKCQDRIFVES